MKFPLQAEDFLYQEKSTYLFEHWLWKHRVPSPLGDFEVMLSRADGDLRDPDAGMLRRAEELIRFTESNGEYILDLVYGSYLQAHEVNDWLEMADVPRALSRAEILAYIRDDRTLNVSHRESEYSSGLLIVPLWDEEHALPMDFENGAITKVSDAPFKLEAGVLRFPD